MSFAAAIGLVVFGLAGPISGWLMGRIGVRNVVLLSLVITAGALIATSMVREIWQLTLAFGLLSGLGTGLVASVLGPTVATRWFVRQRGLVTGVLGASTSTGQLIFFPLLTTLAVVVGWRPGHWSWRSVARPARPGPGLVPQRPSRCRRAAARRRPRARSRHVPPPERGIMGRAVRTSDFWFLAGTFFVCGATSNGLVGQHFIPHAVDHGFTRRRGVRRAGGDGLLQLHRDDRAAAG